MNTLNTRKDDGYRLCTIASFDRWAKLYAPFLSLFRLKGVRRETVKMSDARPGDRVLDVCTGTGDVALEFAKRCDDVTGIDLSAEMLAIARRKDREGRVRFLQMDATKLDFADKGFDVSTISFGLHDMPLEVRGEVLQEMARVTRKRIVIVDYNPPPNRLLRVIYIAIVSLWESKYFPDFARSDFEGLLARCGLKVEAEKMAWLGFVRICVCRLDKEARGTAIVKADIADAPAIYGLASHYSGATQEWAQERINDLISDSQGHYVLVAKQLDSTVGYAIARFAWGKMHVWDIAVKEDVRRRGIGRKMMSQLIDHAKSRELSEVYLEMRASNVPAVRMYQSLSFKIRFRMPGMYDGEDGLAMYLPLLQEGGKQGREEQRWRE
ncbi:MAG: GNAT family N-acetyltransferase [Anaerolineae bacterium]|nr:GNAT family N-acetyltransferase [Anaerolineae bacterium]